MKKNWLFFLSLSIFLALRLFALSKKESPVSHQQVKPSLPPPITVTRTHPWVAMQPFVNGEALELVRDLEKIRHLSKQIPHLSEEELTALMMQKLLILQSGIPFTFPETLYNVLCISEPQEESLIPYHVVKRLYLGESDLGFPVYLDVRCYDVDPGQGSRLKEWLVQTVEGNTEELVSSGGKNAYLCRGKRNTSRRDPTHGFSALQKERGLFVQFFEQGSKLYVCYAEAPWTTFAKYEPLFRSLANP